MIYDSYYESRVLNKVNETNLESICILGLFGRYNIEIPFDKQVNIFIGENGLGKTTILNCIYYLLEKKFSRLADIYFSEITIKFKEDPKNYKISVGDIREYNRKMRGDSLSILNKREIFEDILMDDILFLGHNNVFETYTDYELEYLTQKLAQKIFIPISDAREIVQNYIEDIRLKHLNSRTANGDNVIELIKAISENVSHRIIYLPTYRRIENDFASLNLKDVELDNKELLIRFGMGDVQKSIDKILKEIQLLAMEGFTAMTGVLLKQYADGIDPIEEMNKRRKKYVVVEENTVKIVLDRVGKDLEL